MWSITTDTVDSLPTNLCEQRPPGWLGDGFVMMNMEKGRLEISNSAIVLLTIMRHCSHGLICSGTDGEKADFSWFRELKTPTAEDVLHNLSACCFGESCETDDVAIMLFLARQVADVQGT